MSLLATLVEKDLLIKRTSIHLEEKIGEGAYSQVWKGTYTLINGQILPVAVKKIQASNVEVCFFLLLSFFLFFFLFSNFLLVN